jgi:arsenite methyltransferase
MTDYLQHVNDYENPDVAQVFDELSLWSSRFARLLFEHLELKRDIEALDLATGNGFPLFELAHVHGESCRFTGVDIWRAALNRAAHKRQIYGLKNVRLALTDGAALPFADESFDLIISHLGVNNFADPTGVMAECYRATNPGGRLVLTSNLVGHMREFYDVFRAVLEESGKHEYVDRLNGNIAHRGTPETFTQLVEGAGFEITKLVKDHFTMRFLDGSALLRHSLTKVGFLDGWRAVVDPAEWQTVFGKVEARLNEAARETGELRMTVPMLYLEARKR